MEALTSPRVLSISRARILKIEATKNPVALLHSRNARRLQRHYLRPGRPLSTPCCRDPPLGRRGRFVSLFVLLETAPQVARSSRAAFYSPKWYARPAWTGGSAANTFRYWYFRFQRLINRHDVSGRKYGGNEYKIKRFNWEELNEDNRRKIFKLARTVSIYRDLSREFLCQRGKCAPDQ